MHVGSPGVGRTEWQIASQHDERDHPAKAAEMVDTGEGDNIFGLNLRIRISLACRWTTAIC
jgi:hypothetical protein